MLSKLRLIFPVGPEVGGNKANAYGHGAVLAPVYSAACRWFLCSLTKPFELREAGIAKSILILGVSSLEAVPFSDPAADYS